MKASLLVGFVLLGSASAVELLATTDHFQGANQMVTINSASGAFKTVLSNFSTWDIPDAAFDSTNNILYACTRVSKQSEELELIAYDRTGAEVGKRVKLDKHFAPDNLGAPYYDAKLKKLIMFYQPYDKKLEKTFNKYVEVDPATGLTTKTVNISTEVITNAWELALDSDAYDSANRIIYQFWQNPKVPLHLTLASVNLETGELKHIATKLDSNDILQDPVFYKGKLYGFGSRKYLVSVDAETGALTVVSKIGLAHNIGPWYSALYKASASAPQMLFVSNTTQGGPGSTLPRPRPVHRVDAHGRRFVISPYARAQQAEMDRQHEQEELKVDDDGFIHTHQSLVGFNLETGVIAQGPVALSAPVTWLSALDSV